MPLEVMHQIVKALRNNATKYSAKRLTIKPNQIDNKFMSKEIIFMFKK